MLARNVPKVGEAWASQTDEEFVALSEVFSRALPQPEALQHDRVMMNRFARLANTLADEVRWVVFGLSCCEFV
jgi:hypothetical protein